MVRGKQLKDFWYNINLRLSGIGSFKKKFSSRKWRLNFFKLWESMLFRIIVLLSFFYASSAAAQDSVQVQVVHRENGTAIPFAYISVYNAQKQWQYTLMAGEDGKAAFAVNEYPCKVEVSAIGFTPYRSTLLKAPSGLFKIMLDQTSSSLNEVVVTGVSSPIKAQDALSVYKIINAASIRAQGAISLNEVLANQLNISIANDGVLGAGVRMQGLNGDKVKTLIDGVAVNGREGGNVDMGQISLFNVERIEIVQGPMSIIYGSDALGGVINVIEKQNRKPYEFQATANYETIGKYNFNLGAARSWKKHSLTLGGGRNYFQGWKYLDAPVTFNTNIALAQRHMLFKPKEQYVANAGYQYQAASGFKAGFATNFLREKVTNKGPVSTYDPLNGVAAKDEYYYNTRSQSRLSLSGNIQKATWQILNGYAYYRRVRNTYVTDLTTLSKELSSAQGVQDTSVFNDISSRGMYQNKLGKLDLTAGYDMVLQKGKSQKISGSNNTIDDYAVFALATLPFLKNEQLKLQAGIRAAYNSRFETPLIPAANLLYSLNKDLQLRASYAKGFRAPSLKEMYLSFVDQNHKILGNDLLTAEQSDHLQFSVSGNLYRKQNNYARLLVTGFYNNVSNGILLVPTRPKDSTSIEYTYANLSRQKNAIANVQIDGQIGELNYLFGFAYSRTFAQADYDAFNTHEFNSNLFYYWKKGKIGMSVFYKFNSAQPFLSATIDGSASYDGRQPEYHMLDASIERKFWKKRLGITVGVKNILDVQTLNATGLTTGGIHSGSGTLNFLPRSMFTTFRLMLDK